MPHNEPQFLQARWMETGDIVMTPFSPDPVADGPATTPRGVDTPNERQPALVCPRCKRASKQYSPKIALCPKCYLALCHVAQVWTEADALRAWLHSRLDPSGFPVEDSALTVAESDIRQLYRLRERARGLHIDWRTAPALMTTAARLKLLVDAVTDGKAAPFTPVTLPTKPTPATAKTAHKTTARTSDSANQRARKQRTA